MKKDYKKPEVELISLIAKEQVALETHDDGFDIGGSMDTESSIF